MSAKDGPSTGGDIGEGRILVAGLGNPGRRYRENRHNLGFMVVSKLADKHDIQVNRLERSALIGNGIIFDRRVILAKPQTFMNRSGAAISQLVRYYKIPRSNLLVVYDEIDLPLTSIRLREKGGSGGHNGMRSIIDQIGENFARLRLGVGRPPGQMDPASFLLQNFLPAERIDVELIIEEGIAAIETFIQQGIELAMTRHNKTEKADPTATGEQMERSNE